jgi:hypothetical protein
MFVTGIVLMGIGGIAAILAVADCAAADITGDCQQGSEAAPIAIGLSGGVVLIIGIALTSIGGTRVPQAASTAPALLAKPGAAGLGWAF